MDERVWSVMRSVQEFVDEALDAVRLSQSGEGQPTVARRVAVHLGSAPGALPVVRLHVDAHQFVNLDVALAALVDEHGGGELIGVGGGDQRHHQAFGDILQDRAYERFPVGAVDRVRLDTGPASTRDGVAYGVHLFRYTGTPVAVLQRQSSPHHGASESGGLEVVAAGGSAQVTGALLADVRRLMVERSVFRGQVLSFGLSDNVFGHGGFGYQFLPRPDLAAGDVILPAGALERVERHVAGTARHRAALIAAGQHLKRGLLLYGPPGTGKTHTVRYLLSQLPEVTCVVLAGQALGLVRSAADLAQALQPSVVVLEDVDLIAEHRELHLAPQPLLFTLLDAMDGLAAEADIAFVLTTNRADLLEAALTQRPGRVDLAVEIPLPDDAARRRLVRLYAKHLPIGEGALDDAAARSAGATASFFKELVRRCVLLAAERGKPVGDATLVAALDEMLDEREALTRTLLGHAPGDEGEDVDQARPGVPASRDYGWFSHGPLSGPR